ncbi:pilus assembly FimT family protein [Desulfatibacillum aliphaticivorans]|nr:prepilin-type N-terminal cleavage/methylation domain-containing protein [Desulfatibacillum aliphaticivorans]
MADRANQRIKGRQGGFSLMELMAVISLLGILFFVIVPRFEEAASAGDMDELVRLMSANVAKERETAIANQSLRSLYIDFEERTYGTDGPPLTEEELMETERQGTQISEAVTLLDVEWPGGILQTDGVAQLPINKMGYIAHAALHLEDQDGPVTMVFEPFLGKARFYKGYVSLDEE